VPFVNQGLVFARWTLSLIPTSILTKNSKIVSESQGHVVR